MDILMWQTNGRKMPVSLGPAGRGSVDKDGTISKVTLTGNGCPRDCKQNI